MITDETVLLRDEIDDSTISINDPTLSETLVLKDHKAKLSKHNFLNQNWKTLLTIGSFILIIIISILVKYTYDYTADSSKNSKDISSEDITKQKESIKPTTDEKKIVPLLIGKNQDTVEDIITNSGFLLGNITSEYNDTIPSGQVINQSPSADKSCDKDTKIDLVISLGQKTTHIEPQTKSNENVTENSYATPSNNNSNNSNNNNNNNGKGNGKDKQQKDKKLKK
ncbi:PASTA domain-containing protein [Clostridium saccharobutylicum]|nr:PASTA domain-containing protein [Clostridium saccharobutylicum]NOW64942.1 beta-lactam-binding protein with PASTA domain [Clostridium saccharobutylicum]